MPAFSPILLGLGLLAAGSAGRPDFAQVREMLYDRQNPAGQSQAALLLVQDRAGEAEKAVRQGLRQAEDVEVFQVLAGAVRIRHDERFNEELFSALTGGRPLVRQAAAETLSVLSNP